MVNRRLRDVDIASKQEVMPTWNNQDPANMDKSPIMMVKSVDGEGHVVQVLVPPTGDEVSSQVQNDISCFLRLPA